MPCSLCFNLLVSISDTITDDFKGGGMKIVYQGQANVVTSLSHWQEFPGPIAQGLYLVAYLKPSQNLG